MATSSIINNILELQKSLYSSCNLKIGQILEEQESKEYSACSFVINNKKAQFRIAKITPTKIGQFVTFWKRSHAGPIAPFDMNDGVDLFIVTTQTESQKGQFVFPKDVLYKHGFISNNNIGGKRAMRVYPSWDKPDNKQAIKTQEWQLKYFFDFSKQINCSQIQKLFA